MNSSSCSSAGIFRIVFDVSIVLRYIQIDIVKNGNVSMDISFYKRTDTYYLAANKQMGFYPLTQK